MFMDCNHKEKFCPQTDQYHKQNLILADKDHNPKEKSEVFLCVFFGSKSFSRSPQITSGIYQKVSKYL